MKLKLSLVVKRKDADGGEVVREFEYKGESNLFLLPDPSIFADGVAMWISFEETASTEGNNETSL